jgi:glyoxylase-like metal-dependent hydrolase (beta-lactamase superfamily II)
MAQGRARMFGLIFSLLAAWLIQLAPSVAMTGETAEFVKLADDVYAYVGKKNDANAMVIVTTQGVVLVDTGNNQPDTRDIAAKIKAVTNQPVRWVVITQYHGDHFGGSPLFTPPATLLVHERVARDLAAMKPHQIKSWRKRFPERAQALEGLAPKDMMMSFPDRMTLNLGGKRIELIYVDDQYNIGDVAVWLPESGVLHGSFAAYKDRHPDIRPDYSHGTTITMLKQLEALLALKPRIVVPSHGPLSDVRDLQNMVDYILLARQKVRVMMDRGLGLPDIVKGFDMNDYKGWDRASHFDWMAETIWRELSGLGPIVTKSAERDVSGVVTKVAEAGRNLTLAAQGREIRLRVSSDTNIEGVADRTQLREGMKVTATYIEPENFNAALGFDLVELGVQP